MHYCRVILALLIVATTANETKAWLIRETTHDYTIKIGDHKLGFADGYSAASWNPPGLTNY